MLHPCHLNPLKRNLKRLYIPYPYDNFGRYKITFQCPASKLDEIEYQGIKLIRNILLKRMWNSVRKKSKRKNV